MSFRQAIEELKSTFKFVGICLFDEQVENFTKNENNCEKLQSQLTGVIIYDLETFNTNNCVPYRVSRYKLKKISGKINRDITERELEECGKDCDISKELIV